MLIVYFLLSLKNKLEDIADLRLRYDYYMRFENLEITVYNVNDDEADADDQNIDDDIDGNCDSENYCCDDGGHDYKLRG